MAAEVGEVALDQRPGLPDLVEVGDHRQHDAELAAGRRLEKGADLGAEQTRPVEAEADRPPAHRRVLLGRRPQIGEHLVAADVEGAEGHRPAPRGVEHRRIEGLLLPELRHAAPRS